MDHGLAGRASAERDASGFLRTEIPIGRKSCDLVKSGHMGQEPSQ
jgi:hypothetical protein